MRIRQVPVGPMHNFGYVLMDEATRRAAAIDPSFDAAPLDAVLDEWSADLEFVLLTHGHFDHASDARGLARRRGARLLAHASSSADKDAGFVHGEVLRLGESNIEVVHTPGHTPDSCCFLAGSALFTGDTLFVEDCGRTDLPESDVDALHRSLLTVLAALPDGLEVHPGHDCGPTPVSNLGRERARNRTLAPRTLAQFRVFMSEP